MVTMVPFGVLMQIVRSQHLVYKNDCLLGDILLATSTYLLSGSADNTMKLWLIRTGECLQTWEFTTAVKRVAWSEDDSKVRNHEGSCCFES